jgi:hypothetical protein
MTRTGRYSPEARERSIRMVLEHEREYSSDGRLDLSHPDAGLVPVHRAVAADFKPEVVAPSM